MEMLREISDDIDAINMHRRMDQDEARDSIERLLILAL